MGNNQSISDAFVEFARSGNLKKVEEMIQEGVSINVKDEGLRSTALIAASYKGHLDIVKLLLKANAKLDIKNKNGSTALGLAVQENHLEIVRVLLEVGANPNLQDEFGYTALKRALQNRNLEMVQTLLKAGANPNYPKEAFLLSNALYYKNLEMVQALLEAGANPNIHDRYGTTPLIAAAELDEPEMFKTLLLFGADPTLVDSKGKTVYDPVKFFFNAVKKGDLEIVEALLKAGANPNFQDETGLALRVASQEGHLEVVQALLKAGANPNLQYGDTALIGASENGHLEIVQALLEAGANPHLQTYYGTTALMLASETGHFEIVQVLEDARKKYYNQEKKKKQTRGLVTVGQKGLPVLPKDVWRIILKRIMQEELCSDLSDNSNNEMLLVMAEMDFGVPKEVIEKWRDEKSKSDLCKIVSGLLSIGAMYSEKALDYLVQRERLSDAFNSKDIDAFRHILKELGIEETYYDQYGEERKKSINTLLDELKMRK